MRTFPWNTHRINLLTVERPKPVLKAMLHHNGYRHWCNHGTFGDELWLHETMSERRQVHAKLSRIHACGPNQVRQCEPIANPSDKMLHCNGEAADLAECTSMMQQHNGTLPRALHPRWEFLYCSDYDYVVKKNFVKADD